MEQQGNSAMVFQNAAHSSNVVTAVQPSLVWQRQPSLLVQMDNGKMYIYQQPLTVWVPLQSPAPQSVPGNVTGFRSTPSTSAVSTVSTSKDTLSPAALHSSFSKKVNQHISKLTKIAPKGKTCDSIPNESAIEKAVLYVNPKQYARIMKRRKAVAALVATQKIPATRQKYLYESRHKHAMRRIRENCGRFISGKSQECTSIE